MLVSILQVLISGVVLFLLYRYLFNILGAEGLGIWSIVLASTTVSRFSELGLSGSAVKFVAKYLARSDRLQAAVVIQTSIITIGILLGVVILMVYPAVYWFLSFVIPNENIGIARDLLPFALLSVWLSGIGGVFQSGIDGCMRSDIRAWNMVSSSILLLVLAVILAPKYGLLGLAYSQIAQACFVLFTAFLILKYHLPEITANPWRWDTGIFKELFYYGVNFQITSILSLLFDPITKAWLSKFGGLAMVGYFEMANKMIMQFRAVLVGANQVLVPFVAGFTETSPQAVADKYLKNWRLLAFVSIPFYGAMVAAIPLISEIWIGRYEPVFVTIALILSVGWFLNTFAAPAYFFNQGTGDLTWNTLGHLATGLINLVLGFGMGLLFGGWGVMLGWFVSLVVGSSLMIFAIHRRHDLPTRCFFTRADLALFVACLSATIIAWGIYLFSTIQYSKQFLVTAEIVLSYMTIIAISLWKHPTRNLFVPDRPA